MREGLFKLNTASWRAGLLSEIHTSLSGMWTSQINILLAEYENAASHLRLDFLSIGGAKCFWSPVKLQ